MNFYFFVYCKKKKDNVLIVQIGVFGFGAACTVLTTDVAKYTIGRLRPHFMKICVPDIDCSLAENQHKYFEQFTCTTAGSISAKMLKDIR